MKLRKMGITEENVADIEEVLDPRLIELADWLQDEFLVQTRNEYNETHKRMFLVLPWPPIEAIYFPLKISLPMPVPISLVDLDNPDKDVGQDISTRYWPAHYQAAVAHCPCLDITGADALSVIS
jgi:hypothetical protein